MLAFNSAAKTKPLPHNNVGSYFDIPTGNMVRGARGETIINGGITKITGVVGSGNNYKSTLLHYFMLAAANYVFATRPTFMSTYDTEVNVSLPRLEYMASTFEYVPPSPITESMVWDVSDKSILSANDWVKGINKYVEGKIGDKNSYIEYTALVDPYTKDILRVPTPTFVEIDSLSELEGEASTSMLEDDLEDSKTNTFALKQGMFKHKFLSQLPRLSGSSNTIFLLTAHIGQKIDMATGPAKYQRPSKQLQYLNPGDTIKGVTNKFNYLVNGGALFAHTGHKYLNGGTKLPEYPLPTAAKDPNELNSVKVTQLRGKNGSSGYSLTILISQYTGVLLELSQFDYIKTNDRFGMTGTMQNYGLVLYPTAKLSRTTVRGKIDADPLLGKAVQFTSDLLQLQTYHRHLGYAGLLCSPEELYQGIIDAGYKWEELLATRSWHTPDQYSDKIPPFLSIVDLLKMRKGLYHPYWMKEK